MSVVIPCHNYGHFLPLAVQSVLAQEGVDLELIVIDDCSTDGSAEVASALATREPRIEVRTHTRNRGHIATYNEGVEASSGDYIVLLSADDLLAPGSLARAAALLEAHPQVGLAYGRAIPFSSPDPPPSRERDCARWRLWHGHDWIRARCRQGWNVIYSPEAMMRATVQRAIGGYRAHLPRTADFEMWLRAASVSDVGRLESVEQAFYRVHPGSMSHTTHGDWHFQLREMASSFATVAAEGLVPDAERQLERAKRALAVRALRELCRTYHRPGVTDRFALETMSFAQSLVPDAQRLIQWRSLQWRRWLLRRWSTAPRCVLELLSYLERGVHWRWLRWTGQELRT